MRPPHASASCTTYDNLFDKFSVDANRLSAADADDLAQDSALFYLEHSQQFGDKTASYIRQRCYWEAQHALAQSRRRSRNVVALDDCQPDALISSETLEDSVIAKETEAENRALVGRLLECTEQLPDRQRQIINLLAQNHRQYLIAQRLGVSRPAVQQCLSRARAALRAQLNLVS